MNQYDFTVETPQAWKNELFTKTQQKKAVRMKPVAVLAAVLAVLIGISGTVFAGKVIRAPEYFGSLLLGDTPEAGEVYSAKNTVFESSREDLQLTCTGIVGDKLSLQLIFRLTSTGDLLFDPDYTYLFETNSEDFGFFSEMGKSIGSTVVDERTLEMHVDMSNISGGNFVGKKVSFLFADLEKYKIGGNFSDTEVIPCAFEGEIVVDYANTTQKLGKTQNSITVNGVMFKPVKGEISNLHLDYVMEVADGLQTFDELSFEKFVTGTLTVQYADGTSDTFALKQPPEDDNDAFAGTIGRDDNKIHFVIRFPKLIYAANVKSVSVDGVVLFAK